MRKEPGLLRRIFQQWQKALTEKPSSNKYNCDERIMDNNVLFSLGSYVVPGKEGVLRIRLVNGLVLALEHETFLEIDLVGVDHNAIEILANVLDEIEADWPEEEHGSMRSLITFTPESPSESVGMIMGPDYYTDNESQYDRLRSTLIMRI